MPDVRINAEHRMTHAGRGCRSPSAGSMTQCYRARQPRVTDLVLDLELALFGHALEGLAGILDAVLVIFAVRWQQPNHLVGAARAWSADRA